MTVTENSPPPPSQPGAARPAGRSVARLFGTDGIRGVANLDLKPTIAYDLGRATARRLAGPGGTIVVGQDTRRSGDMFVAAIVSGATSLGVDVHRVGVVPTPALAFIAGSGGFAAGIMVSASHNPAEDNGLKVLDSAGLKLDDVVEDELEQLIWRSAELGARRQRRARAGRSTRPALLDRYRDHRVRIARSCRPTCGSCVDCANGSGCVVAGRDHRGHRRTGRGDPRRAGRVEHQPGLRGDRARLARGGRRRARRRPRLRPRRRRGPVRGGRRDWARRRRRPAHRPARPRPARPRRARRRRPRRLGPLERRAPGRRSRPPAGSSSGRPSATSTSSRGCRSRAPSSAARRAAT